MILRSRMSRGSWWIGTLLGLPILGATALSAVFYLVYPEIVTDDFEWLNHPLTRIALSTGLFIFAGWLSAQFSRTLSRVDLQGDELVLRHAWSGKTCRESLKELRALLPDGGVEFADGRRFHLGDHPRILQEIRRRRATPT